MIDKQLLNDYLRQEDIQADEGMLDAFDRYASLLVDWNDRMNLTAITDPQEIVVKHFLDSVLAFQGWELKENFSSEEGFSLIDVGTGAGFPGVPLKILRPDIRLTLLDSLNKRVNFLEALSEELGQHNSCIHGRAEELARRPEYRERYNMATSRAVAALPALCEYCLPFVKVGGVFAALKGPDVEEEARASERAVDLLGGELEELYEFELPGGQRRTVVLIRKISQTPAKYPRAAVKITKFPL